MTSRSRALTLLEVLVAMSVVVLVILSLIGTTAFVLRGAQSSQGREAAMAEAQRLLEIVRERDLSSAPGFNDPPSARHLLEAPPFQLDFSPGSGLKRRIVTSRLSTSPSHHLYKVYKVSVTLYWEAKGRESHLVLETLDRVL